MVPFSERFFPRRTLPSQRGRAGRTVSIKLMRTLRDRPPVYRSWNKPAALVPIRNDFERTKRKPMPIEANAGWRRITRGYKRPEEEEAGKTSSSFLLEPWIPLPEPGLCIGRLKGQQSSISSQPQTLVAMACPVLVYNVTHGIWDRLGKILRWTGPKPNNVT
jgi:hypothetical protein